MNDSIKKTEIKPKKKSNLKIITSIIVILFFFSSLVAFIFGVFPNILVEKDSDNTSELINAKAQSNTIYIPPILWPGIICIILVVLFAILKAFIYFSSENKANRKNSTRANLLNKKEQKQINLQKIAEKNASTLLNNNDVIDRECLDNNDDESNSQFKLFDDQ